MNLSLLISPLRRLVDSRSGIDDGFRHRPHDRSGPRGAPRAGGRRRARRSARVPVGRRRSAPATADRWTSTSAAAGFRSRRGRAPMTPRWRSRSRGRPRPASATTPVGRSWPTWSGSGRARRMWGTRSGPRSPESKPGLSDRVGHRGVSPHDGKKRRQREPDARGADRAAPPRRRRTPRARRSRGFEADALRRSRRGGVRVALRRARRAHRWRRRRRAGAASRSRARVDDLARARGTGRRRPGRRTRRDRPRCRFCGADDGEIVRGGTGLGGQPRWRRRHQRRRGRRPPRRPLRCEARSRRDGSTGSPHGTRPPCWQSALSRLRAQTPGRPTPGSRAARPPPATRA